MSIERKHTNDRMSQAVIHGDTVYLAGQVAQNARGKSVKDQTTDILAAIDSLLAEDAPLVKKLAGRQDAETVAREAFFAILGRAPDEEEIQRSVEFLHDADAGKIRQFCWALMAGAEFRINH